MIKRGFLKKRKTFSTQEVKFPLTINECHENKLKYPAIIWLDFIRQLFGWTLERGRELLLK